MKPMKIITKYWVTSILLMTSGGLLANDSYGSGEQPLIRVIQTGPPGLGVQIEAKRALLPEVFAAITRKTGVPIRYSVLPEGWVTATCFGKDVSEVLQCLLGANANLVVRYSDQSLANNEQSRLAEVWLLGASFEKKPTQGDCVASLPLKKSATQPNNKDRIAVATAERQRLVNIFLERVRADNPEERMGAIETLGAQAQQGDQRVLSVLHEALSDDHPHVRGQAIISLKRLEGRVDGEVLQQGLQDSDALVRMTALEMGQNDIGIIEQALYDSDREVRQFAKAVLKGLKDQRE